MTEPLDLDAIEREAKAERVETTEFGAVRRVCGVGATPEQTLALVARVRAAEREAIALAEWSCADCGCRFSKSMPAHADQASIRRCSSCAARDGWMYQAKAAEARLLAIARHAARLSKRDDMTDEEAIKHLLLVESDCITWQTDCAKCAETISKSADDYFQMEASMRELEVKLQALMAKDGKNQ